ncbi:MAG: hypothetical protein VKL23_07975 [Cyanobacteriota bacterium]|nr:hypothetical protein [Cyanobacteriota bacterium]
MGSACLPLLASVAEASTQGVPVMYATRAEAEAAAKKHFNCTGAHPMGQHWMPCTQHGQTSGSAHNSH